MYIKKRTCFVLGEFLKFGFSQFHRDWLNHRGAGAWKGCSSGMFSKSYLEILVWKKERTESNIFQRLLSITRKMCTTVKSKKLRKDALHNKFISTFPTGKISHEIKVLPPFKWLPGKQIAALPRDGNSWQYKVRTKAKTNAHFCWPGNLEFIVMSSFPADSNKQESQPGKKFLASCQLDAHYRFFWTPKFPKVYSNSLVWKILLIHFSEWVDKPVSPPWRIVATVGSSDYYFMIHFREEGCAVRAGL